MEDAVLGIPNADSDGLIPSGPSSLADLFSRDSIIDLCWSRTDKLRWSCSLIMGSWVWNPGDKHAIPTVCMVSPSRAVMGPPGGRADRPPEVGRLVERSSFRGRGRVCVCIAGEEGGSFLTITLGGLLPFWDLLQGGKNHSLVSLTCTSIFKTGPGVDGDLRGRRLLLAGGRAFGRRSIPRGTRGTRRGGARLIARVHGSQRWAIFGASIVVDVRRGQRSSGGRRNGGRHNGSSRNEDVGVATREKIAEGRELSTTTS